MKQLRADGDGVGGCGGRGVTEEGARRSSGPSASLTDGRGGDKPSVNTELWPSAGLAELPPHSAQSPLPSLAPLST